MSVPDQASIQGRISARPWRFALVVDIDSPTEVGSAFRLLTSVAPWVSKEIAAELGISDRTVQTHTGNLLAKLHVTSRTQAALIAVRQGLVDPES